jgi:hypothetical protein
MEMISFTPLECVDQIVEGCEELVAYARWDKRYETIEEAKL